MDETWVVAVLTAGLLVLSAFFVAVEFSLIAARRYRLEEQAEHSASARAALRSASELSLLLAGSQLGITLCTLALGATTKPAVHHLLTPLLAGWGLPHWAADVAGFVLALVVVTFLHLVLGEMAPKSWAIAHPERSAILLALPMRAFLAVTRWPLRVLNHWANLCLRAVGVTPVDQVAAGQDAAALRELVEHSAASGQLDPEHHARLARALELEQRTAADLLTTGEVALVEPGATAADVRTATARTGHARVLVGTGQRVDGVVHVRDVLVAAADEPARAALRPVQTVAADTPAYEVLRIMRRSRSHLAVVVRAGDVVGVLTLADILTRLLETS